ncbi:MAG: hypothetical protein ACJ72O_17765 [Marmoricola sp.]
MIDEILVADTPEAWASAGFTVDDDHTCRVGTVRIRLIGDDGQRGRRGIVGWSLRALVEGDLDGILTTTSDQPAAEPAVHPNGVTSIDHVVLLSPDLDRTKAALAEIDLEPRRERDGELGGSSIRQVFYRLGDTILEVIGSPDTAGSGPSSLWGITYVSDDVDASAAFFGEKTSALKDAVQPGRRITTLRHRDLDLSVRTALISPHVKG